VRTLLAIIACIQLFLVASLGWVAVVIVYLPTFWFDKRRILSGRTLRRVAKAAITTSPVWRFRVHGEFPKNPGKAVCVSNHCSHTDVFLISHVPWEMKWLAKRSLFHIPFIGWSMRLVKDVPIDRASPSAAKAALDKCARWLEQGVPGTQRALLKGDWRPSRARGMLTVGTPISTQGMTHKDVPKLKEAARAQIIALRAEILPLIATP
jgi:1-acyl-sn-glycerol-3-phosphate acyltransferase